MTAVEVNTTPLNTTEGLFSLVSIYDVSEKKAAELEKARLTEALQDSNQKMEQFVDTIAHDLRAPLLSISNLAQWVESDLGAALTGSVKENLQTLRQRSGKMREQLRSLLDYSKAGHIRSISESVDSNQLVRSIADSIDATKNYTMKMENLPTFNTVRAPLEHVLANLIENAAKYGGGKGVISVTAIDEGTFYRFIVKDEGRGIPTEYFEEIFFPLRTLAGADDQSHGMGLAFVKRIVEQSGGQIKLESQLQKGSTFSFTWKKHWDAAEETRTWKSSL